MHTATADDFHRPCNIGTKKQRNKPVTGFGIHGILNNLGSLASDRMTLWTELSWHRIT